MSPCTVNILCSNIFNFSSHTEYVKRESIVIAWLKNKNSPPFDECSCFVCLRAQNKQTKIFVRLWVCTYVHRKKKFIESRKLGFHGRCQLNTIRNEMNYFIDWKQKPNNKIYLLNYVQCSLQHMIGAPRNHQVCRFNKLFFSVHVRA